MIKKTQFLLLAICSSVFYSAQVGINTTIPTATLDVNGTIRGRALTDANSNPNFTRQILADNSGNLGYANRVAKALPADITVSNIAVNAPPVVVATGVSLSEFTPVIISFVASSGSPNGIPTYAFTESGGNIVFDMISPNTSQPYTITIAFTRKN
ncbi:hypothetical protein [Chryseobacterium sp.]|uniref:hypothetical protein n=1 Tax=Chryseobacterium sp. TaxID=1871047 RepID=UPI0035AF73FF